MERLRGSLRAAPTPFDALQVPILVLRSDYDWAGVSLNVTEFGFMGFQGYLGLGKTPSIY